MINAVCGLLALPLLFLCYLVVLVVVVVVVDDVVVVVVVVVNAIMSIYSHVKSYKSVVVVVVVFPTGRPLDLIGSQELSELSSDGTKSINLYLHQKLILLAI